jgi:hypothetical protein
LGARDLHLNPALAKDLKLKPRQPQPQRRLWDSRASVRDYRESPAGCGSP